MNLIDSLLVHSNVHESWKVILQQSLAEVDQDYLNKLSTDTSWLPGIANLFASFRNDLSNLQYILIGESPYPRAESANGIAFFDAAVGSLWSDNGLSKAVNRATSLRNIMKTAILSEGLQFADKTGKLSQPLIAEMDKQNLISTARELFTGWQAAGFLLMNATLVLHPDRKPVKEAIYWTDFLNKLLELISIHSDHPVKLVLWGKIASSIDQLKSAGHFDRIQCEHPYNLSFINNTEMQKLFASLKLLQKK
ncbi:MAG: uracil-DNA glycosylase [Gammaproteobacteria bacterium]|jgi:uracil-DNA glycosylase